MTFKVIGSWRFDFVAEMKVTLALAADSLVSRIELIPCSAAHLLLEEINRATVRSMDMAGAT